MLPPKSIFFLLLSLIATTRVGAWDLKKDKDGIKVYTKKSDASGFRTVKAECIAAGTLTQLAALLADVNRHHEWVYSIKSARLLQKTSPAEFTYYSEVSAPWPCSNRDFIVTTIMTQPSPGILVIDSHTQPGLLPEQPGIVRVTHSESHWVLTLLGNKKVKVEYTIEFEPGGSVPAWVVNMFISEGPYKTFKNLREQAAKYSYSDVHYDFLKE